MKRKKSRLRETYYKRKVNRIAVFKTHPLKPKQMIIRISSLQILKLKLPPILIQRLNNNNNNSLKILMLLNRLLLITKTKHRLVLSCNLRLRLWRLGSLSLRESSWNLRSWLRRKVNLWCKKGICKLRAMDLPSDSIGRQRNLRDLILK